MTRKPTLLIMAAGMGSRYGGLKQLDQVGPGGHTILEYSLFDAIQAGFDTVVFVIRRQFESEFKHQFVDRWQSQIDCRLAFQEQELPWPDLNTVREKPWGTGHAVLAARDQISNPFAVINADDFYGRDAFLKLAKFLQTTCNPHHFGMISFSLGQTVSPHGTVSRGVCEIDDTGHLRGITELGGIQIQSSSQNTASFMNTTDPSRELKAQTPVSMNCWGFHPDMFDSLETQFKEFAATNRNKSKAEFYLPSHVFDRLRAGEIDVSCYPTQAKWYGVTYREDRKEVERALNQMTEEGLYPSLLTAR